LNDSTESAKRITGWRLIQHRGPAVEKVQSPTRVLILTRISVLSNDRSHSPEAEESIPVQTLDSSSMKWLKDE